jgi:diguanylate cyclase (GGDEF)-like protein
MKQLSELGELLQTCRTLDEACRVIERLVSRLFSTASGAVYLLRSSQNLLEAAATWGQPASESFFAPDDCWALRRGRIYRLTDSADGPPCGHAPALASKGSLCVPLMARSEALGLLYLSFPEPTSAADPIEQLATMVAESIALAVANLRLHESLQHQSIRDPLTGLFNRRYMEESFEREIRRATRAQQPVTVLMLDLDQFKLFNDTYGHGAGDRLLQEVGHVLQTSSRGEDIACRYGGEEFTLILPGLSLSQAKAYANVVRERISHVRVEYRRERLAPVTVSVGIAVFPAHGHTADAVLAAADTALYRSKHAGRNRVCTSEGDASAATMPRAGAA